METGMESILSLIMNQILHGGPQMIAVLSLIIGILIFDRKRLTSEISKKDERLSKIVEEYYKGNISLTEALNSLKLVLHEIRISLNNK
jgi:predicted HTH domain antitoxin